MKDTPIKTLQILTLKIHMEEQKFKFIRNGGNAKWNSNEILLYLSVCQKVWKSLTMTSTGKDMTCWKPQHYC